MSSTLSASDYVYILLIACLLGFPIQSSLALQEGLSVLVLVSYHLLIAGAR